MFDIGFTELLICLVVALVVIGPERLPETVRTVSLWIGRLKRSLRETRSEIERQIGADDIRRQLHNEEIMENIEKARLEMETTYNNMLADTRAALDSDAKPQAQTYDHEELPDHAHGADHQVPPAAEIASTTDTDSNATVISDAPVASNTDNNNADTTKQGQS